MDLAKIRKKARRGPQANELQPPLPEPAGETVEGPTPSEGASRPPEPSPLPVPGSAIVPEPPSLPEAFSPPDPTEFSPSPPEVDEARVSPVPGGVEGLAEGVPQRPEAPSNRERVLLFSVGREHYAMPIQDISLIIEDRPTTPVPSVPPFVAGIISLRGRIVTILDARTRLALGEEGVPEGAKIVVLDRGADQFGIRVDNIIHVLEVDRLAMEAPPEGFHQGEREFVDGVFYYKGTAVAALDLERFLAFQV